MRLRIQLPEGATDWESNVALFRVGRADTCALRLEGESAKYSGWEHAEFSMDDEGNACVTDLTSKNGTYVDGVRITEPTPLRVGATVQIGTKGPQLKVVEIARPVPVVQSRPPSAATGASARLSATGWQKWALAGGIAIALLVAIGLLLHRKGDAPKTAPEVAQNGDVQNQAGANSDASAGHGDPNSTDPYATDRNVRPTPEHQEEAAPFAKVSPPEVADPWQPAKESGISAFRLLAVEEPKSKNTRPFAGSVLVGPQTLLTTADVAIELAGVVARGWRAKAVRDSQDAGVALGRIRVLTAFQDTEFQDEFQETQPDVQLFFDLALIDLAARADGPIVLATTHELASFKQGQPLICQAVSHRNEPFNEFEERRAEANLCRVFMEKRLSADAPRLLFLRGTFGENIAGSPILNQQGHLVAVYCDHDPVEEGKSADRTFHYAAIVEPGLVKLGLDQSDHPAWTAPAAPAQPIEKEEPAK